uniref:Uncharacterized protein n=1 Tax=Mycena chlorophos TaxID=658473 RepID=A0ABQ0MDG3_MYCCL|nr:predicted protein [Mycena chlorophos]
MFLDPCLPPSSSATQLHTHPLPPSSRQCLGAAKSEEDTSDYTRSRLRRAQHMRSEGKQDNSGASSRPHTQSSRTRGVRAELMTLGCESWGLRAAVTEEAASAWLARLPQLGYARPTLPRISLEFWSHICRVQQRARQGDEADIHGALYGAGCFQHATLQRIPARRCSDPAFYARIDRHSNAMPFIPAYPRLCTSCAKPHQPFGVDSGPSLSMHDDELD